jgi:hypothetical protein
MSCLPQGKVAPLLGGTYAYATVLPDGNNGEMQRFLCLAAASGALAAACVGTGLAAADTASPMRVTFVGDSVAGALGYVPAAEQALGRGLDMQFDLRVCRRLASTGCPYDGATPASALTTVDEDGSHVGRVLVVDVGYNDDPSLYRRGMDDLIRTAGSFGVKRIVWVTLREAEPIYRETNAVIRAEARRFPQVTVADWNAASVGRSWFRSDGLHLTPGGVDALAAWLRPYVLQAVSEAS